MVNEGIVSLKTNPGDYVFVNRRTGKVFTPKRLTYASTQKSPGLAVFLNILWPGLGYVYLGYAGYIFYMLFSALFFVAWYGALIPLAIIESRGRAPGSLVFLVLGPICLSSFLTLACRLGRTARRLNAGYPHAVAERLFVEAVRKNEVGETVSTDRAGR